ncbi:hypothetical protein BC832DRAFT_588302 [Gaertneriomyces semiglobifer]|nr:hypothetical protein BC832DRAFT_588302 [Gaertneriomyces semiglobifer]
MAAPHTVGPMAPPADVLTMDDIDASDRYDAFDNLAHDLNSPPAYEGKEPTFEDRAMLDLNIKDQKVIASVGVGKGSELYLDEPESDTSVGAILQTLDDRPPPLPVRSPAGVLPERPRSFRGRVKTKVTKAWDALTKPPPKDPTIKHPRRGLTPASLKDVGLRLRHAAQPYMNVMEILFSIMHWQDPWRTGALATAYFYLWASHLLTHVLLFSPLLFFAATFLYRKPLLTLEHSHDKNGGNHRLSFREAIKASIPDSSIAAAIDPFKSNPATWWRALGEVYGRGQEGVGLLGDTCVALEKVKNVLTWKPPYKTLHLFGAYSCFLIFTYSISVSTFFWILQFLMGLYVFVIHGLRHHHPKYKNRMDLVVWFFEDVPAEFEEFLDEALSKEGSDSTKEE